MTESTEPFEYEERPARIGFDPDSLTVTYEGRLTNEWAEFYTPQKVEGHDTYQIPTGDPDDPYVNTLFAVPNDDGLIPLHQVGTQWYFEDAPVCDVIPGVQPAVKNVLTFMGRQLLAIDQPFWDQLLRVQHGRLYYDTTDLGIPWEPSQRINAADFSVERYWVNGDQITRQKPTYIAPDAQPLMRKQGNRIRWEINGRLSEEVRQVKPEAEEGMLYIGGETLPAVIRVPNSTPQPGENGRYWVNGREMQVEVIQAKRAATWVRPEIDRDPATGNFRIGGQVVPIRYDADAVPVVDAQGIIWIAGQNTGRQAIFHRSQFRQSERGTWEIGAITTDHQVSLNEYPAVGEDGYVYIGDHATSIHMTDVDFRSLNWIFPGNDEPGVQRHRVEVLEVEAEEPEGFDHAIGTWHVDGRDSGHVYNPEYPTPFPGRDGTLMIRDANGQMHRLTSGGEVIPFQRGEFINDPAQTYRAPAQLPRDPGTRIGGCDIMRPYDIGTDWAVRGVISYSHNESPILPYKRNDSSWVVSGDSVSKASHLVAKRVLDVGPDGCWQIDGDSQYVMAEPGEMPDFDRLGNVGFRHGSVADILPSLIVRRAGQFIPEPTGLHVESIGGNPTWCYGRINLGKRYNVLKAGCRVLGEKISLGGEEMPYTIDVLRELAAQVEAGELEEGDDALKDRGFEIIPPRNRPAAPPPAEAPVGEAPAEPPPPEAPVVEDPEGEPVVEAPAGEPAEPPAGDDPAADAGGDPAGEPPAAGADEGPHVVFDYVEEELVEPPPERNLMIIPREGGEVLAQNPLMRVRDAYGRVAMSWAEIRDNARQLTEQHATGRYVMQYPQTGDVEAFLFTDEDGFHVYYNRALRRLSVDWLNQAIHNPANRHVTEYALQTGTYTRRIGVDGDGLLVDRGRTPEHELDPFMQLINAEEMPFLDVQPVSKVSVFFRVTEILQEVVNLAMSACMAWLIGCTIAEEWKNAQKTDWGIVALSMDMMTELCIGASFVLGTMQLIGGYVEYGARLAGALPLVSGIFGIGTAVFMVASIIIKQVVQKDAPSPEAEMARQCILPFVQNLRPAPPPRGELTA
jgi:hypothetical protein